MESFLVKKKIFGEKKAEGGLCCVLLFVHPEEEGFAHQELSLLFMDPSDDPSKPLGTAEPCVPQFPKGKWLPAGATSGGPLAAATPPERLPQGLALARVIIALLSQRLALPRD